MTTTTLYGTLQLYDLTSPLQFIISTRFILVFLVIGNVVTLGFYLVNFSAGISFIFSLSTLIPAAFLLCRYTNAAAQRLSSPTLTAVVAVTFVNVTEFVLSLLALKDRSYQVLKSGCVGSILCNLLLVLGVAILVYFFGGGPKHVGIVDPHVDQPSPPGARSMAAASRHHLYASVSGIYYLLKTTGAMLLLAFVALLLPSLPYITAVYEQSAASGSSASASPSPAPSTPVLQPSRWTALVSLTCYFFYLAAHLKGVEVANTLDRATLMGMLGSTVFIGIPSYVLLNTLEETSRLWATTQRAIATLLLPLASNVAELSIACQQSYYGNFEVAVAVALGSALQLVCCVLPMLVLVGGVFGRPLDMFIQPFSAAVLLISLLLARSLLMTQSGRVHWLTGWVLCAAYLCISVALLAAPET